MPGGFSTGTGIAVVLIAIIVIWLASGFYRVLPDEVGVVLRFGAYKGLTQQGLNYHLPTPIESVLRPSVTHINRTEIGYRANDGATRVVSRQLPEEALMLTGDENIVDINFTVFWVIKDAKAYLFNIRAPEATVKSAAESAMREIVGETEIARALAEGRGKIESDTQKLLQRILDSYGSGILVTQVQMAKVDPPAPGRIVPRRAARARRQGALRNEVEAIATTSYQRAGRSGAHQQEQSLSPDHRPLAGRHRFILVYRAYKVAQDVTAQRLYLETMKRS